MSVHRAFHGSHLTWPYERNSQRFRVRVVEPDNVRSKNNDRILFAVLQELLNPTMREVDRLDQNRRPVSTDRYDLIPNLADHDAWTHLRVPRDMMRQGWSTRRFQAKQQWSRMSS